MTQKGIASSTPRHIDHYLSMPRSELTTYSPQDLKEMAYEIHCYSYYHQTVINQFLAKADKLKAELDRIIGPVLGNYSHLYGKEEKWLAAIADDGAATTLKNTEVNVRTVVTRLSYLTQRLENVGKCLLEMANERR